jgi:glycosyltransferase involved in cell wall biosynthesis
MTLTGNASLGATTRVTGESVSVVIPIGDRTHDVGCVLKRLPNRVDEVVVVDGRSPDETLAVARAARPDIRIVLEAEPGEGTALRAGFAAARGDYIVMIDADAGIDQAELERFIGALQSGCAAWSRAG